MAMVKVRRDGNSLAVTIPVEEASKAHLQEGTHVSVEADATGELHIVPVSIQRRVRPEIMASAQRVLKRKRRLYERLAAYDRESKQS